MDTPARANFGDSRGAFCSYQAARVKTGVRRAFCCRRSSRRRRENTAAAHSSGGTNQPRSGIGMSAGAQKASIHAKVQAMPRQYRNTRYAHTRSVMTTSSCCQSDELVVVASERPTAAVHPPWAGKSCPRSCRARRRRIRRLSSDTPPDLRVPGSWTPHDMASLRSANLVGRDNRDDHAP